MKLGLNRHEQDSTEMSDEYLEFEYMNLVSDRVVANAVKAVLLKLEIERRRDGVLRLEAQERMIEECYQESLEDGRKGKF